MKIRQAKQCDIMALLDIYNYEVKHGIATLDIKKKTLTEWETWFFAHNIENHPLIIAEIDDESIHTVVSVITSGNAASTKLHQKFGFTFCGTINEVGGKMGRYLDIDNYELRV